MLTYVELKKINDRNKQHKEIPKIKITKVDEANVFCFNMQNMSMDRFVELVSSNGITVSNLSKLQDYIDSTVKQYNLLRETFGLYAKFEAKTKATGLIKRCLVEENSIFIFAPGKHRRGVRKGIYEFFSIATPIIKTDSEIEKAWHDRLKRCELKMLKSGLWPQWTRIFHNLQGVSYADWKKLQEWETDKTLYKTKYPFMFDSSGRFNTDYTHEMTEVKTKTMFFGYANERVKKEIAEALLLKQPYHSGRISANYDVSFEYRPSDNCAWYNEEYVGGGNGHYYLAISPSTAIFYEND